MGFWTGVEQNCFQKDSNGKIPHRSLALLTAFSIVVRSKNMIIRGWDRTKLPPSKSLILNFIESIS